MYDARVKTGQYERPVQSILLVVQGELTCSQAVIHLKRHTETTLSKNNSYLFMSKQASPLITSARD